MGYGGKVHARMRARELRAESRTLQDIATELGVSRASVSVWVRDVEFVPNRRRHNYWWHDHPHPLHVAKLEEIERCRQDGLDHIGTLSEREFLVLGLALYAGEGSKTQHSVCFSNSDPQLIYVYVTWLRHFFEIDESRLRVKLYLHEGLDLDAAVTYWSSLTRIPPEQFTKPYRAVADQTIRRTKHAMGCVGVAYHSSAVLRRVMGLIEAVTSSTAIPG